MDNPMSANSLLLGGFLHWLIIRPIVQISEFVRGLYAQTGMDGLVIDVRYNGGGFIPEMFIEHLLRPHYNSWVPRDGQDWRTPWVAVHGPKVCITNGYAGSGGDAIQAHDCLINIRDLRRG